MKLTQESLIPQRWHLYIVNLEPRIGTKPGKQRPCLAIQPTELNQFGLQSTVILPITSKVSSQEAYPLRVRLPNGLCGLKKESDILVDQILAWDNLLFHKELGELPEFFQQRVKQALKDFLDL